MPRWANVSSIRSIGTAASEKSVQNNATEKTTERVCKTEYDSHTEETGSYRVRYELNGKEGTVVMDHNPGSRIPVRDGKLDL